MKESVGGGGGVGGRGVMGFLGVHKSCNISLNDIE